MVYRGGEENKKKKKEEEKEAVLKPPALVSILLPGLLLPHTHTHTLIHISTLAHIITNKLIQLRHQEEWAHSPVRLPTSPFR